MLSLINRIYQYNKVSMLISSTTAQKSVTVNSPLVIVPVLSKATVLTPEKVILRKLIVPAQTIESNSLVTGNDSPVNIFSSTSHFPSTTTPSRGIASPALTARMGMQEMKLLDQGSKANNLLTQSQVKPSQMPKPICLSSIMTEEAKSGPDIMTEDFKPMSSRMTEEVESEEMIVTEEAEPETWTSDRDRRTRVTEEAEPWSSTIMTEEAKSGPDIMTEDFKPMSSRMTEEVES
ncbi:hypothetical protein Lal_00001298 [Lupinus albus]|nr:hypothetical protein Lal_00001298 [Lupinus albus]